MYPAYFKLDNTNNNDDEKFFNDGLVSIIDNDYVLNYLNDIDPTTKRSTTPTYPNLSSGINQDPTSNIAFPIDNGATIQGENLFSNNVPSKDAWILHNYPTKQQQGVNLPQQSSTKIECDGEDELPRQKRKSRKDSLVKKESNEDSQELNFKSNIKNTYINKINSLITNNVQIKNPVPILRPEEDKIPNRRMETRLDQSNKQFLIKNDTKGNNNIEKNFMKRVRSYDMFKPDERVDKLRMKQAKNCESARNSRKRKKMYIELLEKKVEHLTQELNATKKQLDLNNTNLNKFSTQSKLLNTLVQEKQQLFDKLEKMIQLGVDDSEINLLIDSLRLRLGATGKERINAINYYFKQIYDILIPVHMKYLLWVAVEGKDLFSGKATTFLGNLPQNLTLPTEIKNDTTDYWSALVTQVNLTDNQKNHILKYRKKLIQEKQKFEGLLTTLNQTRKQILKQANSIQNVIDDFRNILTPIQVGKFLIILDKERNRKEFSTEKLWQKVAKKEAQDQDIDDDTESSHDLDNIDNKLNEGEYGENSNNNHSNDMLPFDLDFNKSFDINDFLDQLQKKRHMG